MYYLISLMDSPLGKSFVAHICAAPAVKWSTECCKTAQLQKIAIIMLALSISFTKVENKLDFSACQIPSQNIMVWFSYQFESSTKKFQAFLIVKYLRSHRDRHYADKQSWYNSSCRRAVNMHSGVLQLNTVRQKQESIHD